MENKELCIDGKEHNMVYDYSDGSDDVYKCTRPGCKACYIVRDALGR
jgi:hypothetical protein